LNDSANDQQPGLQNTPAPEAQPGEHIAYLSLGSNINPVENLKKAVALLRRRTRVLAVSTCWETEAVVSQPAQVKWPNFYNLGACVATSWDAEALKTQVLRPIEQELGRVRGADKYAPRPIDLDIVVFDGQVIDAEIWERLYLALIFAEMLPGLRNPETGETPKDTAARLGPGRVAIPRPEIILP
jgi:2-amino-4-hydroxy-6-hydroxymethyldihydropteridine diphosphokinase